MKKFLSIDDFDPSNKRVLVRADLNVPMQDGKITDTTRIDRLAPTIKALSERGARVIVLAHFGRPKGKRDPSMSLAPITPALSKAIGMNVSFIDDCIGDKVVAKVNSMKNGDVVLLENLRYYDAEEENDSAFAQNLAKLGDVYVNDAFSCAHRAHASTHKIATLLPSYAGFLMQAELEALEKALDKPVRPVCAIVGGAKISTKLDLLNNLVKKVDKLVLGGGMANTFLHAIGTPVGTSLCEKDMADNARGIIEIARQANCQIILPIDGVVAEKFSANALNETVGIDGVPADKMVLDIGRNSVAVICDQISLCKTVLWNGPMGAFEIPPFEAGTVAIAHYVAKLTLEGKIVSVAGGGDTVSALAAAGVEDKMTYVSAAGGAFLEWLEGKELPGVSALMQSARKAA